MTKIYNLDETTQDESNSDSMLNNKNFVQDFWNFILKLIIYPSLLPVGDFICQLCQQKFAFYIYLFINCRICSHLSFLNLPLYSTFICVISYPSVMGASLRFSSLGLLTLFLSLALATLVMQNLIALWSHQVARIGHITNLSGYIPFHTQVVTRALIVVWWSWRQLKYFAEVGVMRYVKLKCAKRFLVYCYLEHRSVENNILQSERSSTELTGPCYAFNMSLY